MELGGEGLPFPAGRIPLSMPPSELPRFPKLAGGSDGE
jgi:hypothetical protein